MGDVRPERVLCPGTARGELLVLEDSLSFWGGFDPAEGRIIDRLHPQAGQSMAGKVLALPASRGSGGTPAGLAEALRRGSGPVAVILGRIDVNIAIGAMVAARLYGEDVPVMLVRPDDYAALRTGSLVTIAADGQITVDDPQPA